VKAGRDAIEREQRRDEPEGAARPHPQGYPLPPECRDARIRSGHPIGSVVADRRQQRHHSKRHPEAKHAVTQESRATFACQARPDKQPR